MAAGASLFLDIVDALGRSATSLQPIPRFSRSSKSTSRYNRILAVELVDNGRHLGQRRAGPRMERTKKVRTTRSSARRESRRTMAVIIRDKPPTYDWGWFSREDPRMHLQTVDKDHRKLHYKVWLERKGKRVIEPAGALPPKVLRVLENEIAKQKGRIEAYWIIFMIQNDWLRVRLVGDTIVLYAYPNTPNHFERTVKLSKVIPNEEVAQTVTQRDLNLNAEYGMLEIFPRREEGARTHVPLEDLLWAG
jgi:hypothetical protein